MIVWGIDPGRRFGYAEIQNGELMYSCVYDMDPMGNGDARRWSDVVDFLQSRLSCAGLPDAIGVENAAIASLYPRPQPNQVRAAYGYITAVELWAVRHDVPVLAINPSMLRRAFTGSGRSSKEAVVATVRRLYGRTVATHDEADAIAAALYTYEARSE